MADALDEFFDQHRETLEVACKANDWKIEREGDDRSIVTLELTAADNEHYILKFICDDYPKSPPSVVFVNSDMNPQDKKAWPTGDGNFTGIVKPPQNCFLCMPLTKEGLAHHQDWVQNPNVHSWDGSKHSLIDIFNEMYRLLHSAGYSGRCH